MFESFEARIGYVFSDKSLLRNALTHSSYANENRETGCPDNERMEFLGDAILGFVVAEHLFAAYPNKPEGELTRIRAELVCEKSLANAARAVRLGDELLLGHGEDHNGGRGRNSILSDAMESVFAAVFLDGGLEEARGVIHRLLLSASAAGKGHSVDYKTAFQELAQRKKEQVIQYVLVAQSGPDHDKTFEVEVLLNGEVVGRGTGSSKKRAEQRAAEGAIRQLFPQEI